MPRERVAQSLGSLSFASRPFRLITCAVAGAVSVALVASSYVYVEPAAAAPTPEPPPPAQQTADRWVEPTGTGVVRPDFVSASVTARASGQRVEVLSERSATGRIWVLPDGSREAEQAAGPVRFQDRAATATEGWRDIDVSLAVNTDGSVSPKAVPQTVKLAGPAGSPDALVTVTGTGQPAVSLGAGLARTLPKPVLDGATATYPEVAPGVDVVVEVLPAGFEQRWVVKTRAALDALLKAQAGGRRGVTAALKTGTWKAAPAGGGVQFTDTKGTVVARLAPPRVWDAATTPAGEPTQPAGATFACRFSRIVSVSHYLVGGVSVSH